MTQDSRPELNRAPTLALATRGWVSLNKFAVLIGVSYPTVLKMRDRGDVRCVKVGGINRVYQAEVQRYLKEGNAPQVRTEPETSGEGDESSSPSLLDQGDDNASR
ncbi:hypothetical protein LCGC14_2147920 [marine sediment metagenome]|uniref:Helix-turn-helix domain-containing protein n=1 Tax=marine sediment metagenome TaxID=412755 RepID=A0A0F9DWA1_9ZZZZ